MLVTHVFVAFVAPVLALASASPDSAFEFPANVPLAKRQQDGPAYGCHSDCGNAIIKSRASEYCEDKEWRSLLDGCLDCALEYEIWQWYGDELKPAAEECGIDATPKPAAGDSDNSRPAESSSSTETASEMAQSDKVDATATSSTAVTEVTVPSEPEPTEEGKDDEHVPSDVVPPTPTPTHVEAAAGALGASQALMVAGVAVVVMASFN